MPRARARERPVGHPSSTESLTAGLVWTNSLVMPILSRKPARFRTAALIAALALGGALGVAGPASAADVNNAKNAGFESGLTG